jgi:hypothetical protein
MSGIGQTVSMRQANNGASDDRREAAMTETRTEYFDPESIVRMRAALDEAWRSLPSSQQTGDARNALAKVIVHLASEGERDPDHLSTYAFSAIVLEAPDGAIRF